MVTADQVVVDLQANINKYMGDVARAETRFTSMSDQIARNAAKVQASTEAAFRKSADSLVKFTDRGQTSLAALTTAYAKYNATINNMSPKMSATPRASVAGPDLYGELTKKRSQEMAAAVLSSSNKSVAALARMNTQSATSLNALSTRFDAFSRDARASLESAGVAANTFSTTIQGLPADMASRMQNPFVPLEQWLDQAGAKAYNLQFNLANLTSQVNDIGVTAAGGMNPLIIALQQGTQLSQAFAGQRLGDVAKGIGAAFMSVVSPVSLLTIGAVAAAAALIQWGMSAVSSSDKANTLEKQLDNLNEVLDSVSGRMDVLQDSKLEETYGSLTREVRELTKGLLELDRVAQASTLKETLNKIVNEAIGPSMIQKLGDPLVNSQGFKPFGDSNSVSMTQRNYDEKMGGKGLSYEDFQLRTEMLEVAASAGDVEQVVNQIYGLFADMTAGGPVSMLDTDIRTMLANLGDMAVNTAETEARFNGSAKAAEEAAEATAKWHDLYEDIATTASDMAQAERERAKVAKEETREAERALGLAETSLRYGEQSVEYARAKRAADQEALEIRLRGQGSTSKRFRPSSPW